jgi:REP element-mobilizing transposase RayT
MPYWRLYYHIVWATKNREPLIARHWEKSLHSVIAAKVTSMGAFVHRVGGTDDHIHLVVSVPPKCALSTFIGQVKGNSSHFIDHELSLETHFAWQAEYGLLSFGGKNLETVVEYVQNQRARHAAHQTIRGLEITAPPDNHNTAQG